jgi:pyochelin synthetase
MPRSGPFFANEGERALAREHELDAAGLLASLESIGIHLWLDGTKLCYRAPKGLMTSERLELLRSRRAELTDILRSEMAPLEARHDPGARFEPFPLTDVQAAYLRGRSASYPYGGVGCHGYGELRFSDADPDRINTAWNSLIRRHDMLRAVISADGTQQVFPERDPYRIAVHDIGAATADFAAAVEANRADMDHRVYEPGEWPLFDLRLTRADDAAILHVSIDFLIADFVSIQLLLEELEAEYEKAGSLPHDLEITFRDLQLAIRAARSAPAAERDRAYWRDRIGTLPDPPELPVSPAPSATPRYFRLAGRLAGADWRQFRERAQRYAITPTCAVLAAYAEVIRRWSRRPDFTLNVTVLNRPPIHPQVQQVVGDFTSVELLAVRGHGAMPFGDRARTLQETLWEDLDHGLCSGLEVMRELRTRRSEGLILFPIVFTSSVGIRRQDLDAGGGLDRLVYGISQTPQVWLDCQVMEDGDGLAFNWDVRGGVFAAGTVEAMFGAFGDLLRRLAGSEETWQSPSPVPVPAAQVARRPGTAVMPAARNELLQDRVLEQAVDHPDRPAVISGSRILRYGELAGFAASVAAALEEHGCRPGSLVAVEMDKGWEQIAGVLGILMSGCAYVPVDTTQPVSRRERILADVKAEVVLTQSRLSDRAARQGRRAIAVDTLGPAGGPVRFPRDSGDLAYVIYTSGSTGSPKGVAISHGAALNTIEDVGRRFGVQARDRALGLASLGFDLSVYDIFGMLSAGGCLVLPDADRRADPEHWADLIETHDVTIWNSVPAQLEMLMAFLRSSPESRLASLRLALLSGDWIPVALPDAVRERIPGLRLISLGGATEASIWSIFHPIEDVDRGLPSIPYGRPLSNQSVEILAADLSPVPDLVTGEIYIGGAGLAEGYLGDAEKTAKSFVTDPLTGRRLYRTGDLGRYLSDGNIELLGREDSQIKIRGHRVELAEVEAAMAAHPRVTAAAVVATGQRPEPPGLAAFAEAATCPPGTDRPQVSAAGAGAAAVAGAAQLRARVNDEEMLAFARELDSTALLQMLATLSGSGLFTDGGSHTLDEILGRARVAPRHHRLVRRWLRALHENGLIRRDQADGSYSAQETVDASDVASGWRRVEERMPQIEDRTELIAYFQKTASSLPELLAGELDPLTLLFPEGRTEIHEVAYNAMFLSRYLNRLLTSAACHLSGQHGAAGPFRVLEVGAGVGGTSAELIPALASSGADYLFTDVSEFFLNNARQRYAEYPWVSFGRYDMNQDFRSQGLMPNSYDLVVCANVLHYARDVTAVLSRLKELLLPGGWLLFIEATRDSYQIMTSMEFLFDESSGDFEDIRRLGEQTFVTREQWLDILPAAGADSVLCLPENDPITDQMGMHFFAARFKSGRARVTGQDLEAYLAEQLPAHMVPAEIQVVDGLPLTGNGKVDRKTLASWVRAGASDQVLAGAGEAPLGDLEERIAAIWERLLRAHMIGRHQAFFGLGGDSLLAAQLAAEIHENVPEAATIFYDDLLRHILDNATVASLAALLTNDLVGTDAEASGETGAKTAAGPVVHLGDGPPRTVLVHDATGTLAAYEPVIRALDGMAGLAGLVVPDRASYLGRASDALVDEVAAVYAKALISAGADQLRLVGHGFGGILAAELARQLGEAGVRIARLTVVASAAPAWPVADDRLAEFLFWRELGAGTAFVAPDGAAGAAEPSLETLLETLGSRPRDERFKDLAGFAPGVPIEAAYELYEHSMRAAAAHELLPYAGDMRLIRPRPGAWWPSLPRDMAAYWGEVCLGDLEIIDLACGDAGFVRDAAPVLADLIAGRHAE